MLDVNNKTKYPNPNPIYGQHGSQERWHYLQRLEETSDRQSIPSSDRVRFWQGWFLYEGKIKDAQRKIDGLSARLREMEDADADPIDVSRTEYWLRGQVHRLDSYRLRREVWNRVRWVATTVFAAVIATTAVCSVLRDWSRAYDLR